VPHPNVALSATGVSITCAGLIERDGVEDVRVGFLDCARRRDGISPLPALPRKTAHLSPAVKTQLKALDTSR